MEILISYCHLQIEIWKNILPEMQSQFLFIQQNFREMLGLNEFFIVQSIYDH